VSLELVNGGGLVFSAGVGQRFRFFYGSDEQERLTGFVQRVAACLSATHDRDAARRSPTLDRSKGDAMAWLRQVTASTDGQASYRMSALPPDVLFRIVEDPGASASERAGAAVALRFSLDDVERKRLLSTAEACAEPGLRRALEALAEARNDDALAAAIDVIEGDSPRSTGR
jgi:hypothetical protein